MQCISRYIKILSVFVHLILVAVLLAVPAYVKGADNDNLVLSPNTPFPNNIPSNYTSITIAKGAKVTIPQGTTITQSIINEGTLVFEFDKWSSNNKTKLKAKLINKGEIQGPFEIYSDIENSGKILSEIYLYPKADTSSTSISNSGTIQSADPQNKTQMTKTYGDIYNEGKDIYFMSKDFGSLLLSDFDYNNGEKILIHKSKPSDTPDIKVKDLGDNTSLLSISYKSHLIGKSVKEVYINASADKVRQWAEVASNTQNYKISKINKNPIWIK